MVVFDQVTKIYKEPFWRGGETKRALDQFSFEARPGRVTGLVGGNGAGKTTTFRILAGIEDWDQGRIEVNGLDGRIHYQQLRGQVGLLLEKHAFHKVKGTHVLWERGLLMGMSSQDTKRRASELIEQLDLGDFIHKEANKYSRGQLGRIAIASMLMNKPPVMIFDEPTVGLDFSSAAKVRTLIKSLAGEGRTILLSTHILADIQLLCDDVVGIEHGKRVDDNEVRRWINQAQVQEHTPIETGLGEHTP